MDENKNYLERIDSIRFELLDDVKKVLSDPFLTIGEAFDFDHAIAGFCGYPERTMLEIETIRLEKSTIMCGCFYMEDTDGNQPKPIDLGNFDVTTILRVLDYTRKQLREWKIKELRNLIIKAGEYIKFDGKESFLFCDNPHISDDMDATYHNLNEVRILGFDNVEFVTSDIDEIGSDRVNYEIRQIPDETLDQIIAYIKKRPEKIDIELTDEQLKVMDEFYNAIKKMEEAGIAVIRDAEPDGGFYFVNGKGLEFAGGDGVYDSDNYVSVQDQINEMEMFSYSDLSDWLFCSDFEDLYAKRI